MQTVRTERIVRTHVYVRMRICGAYAQYAQCAHSTHTVCTVRMHNISVYVRMCTHTVRTHKYECVRTVCVLTIRHVR